MKYDPDRHHRRSLRLPGFDYAQPGAYFVTICTQNRVCLLGEIVDGQMRQNAAGEMVHSVWQEMPRFYPGVETDQFVVMPNHIHGIIVLTPAINPVGAGPCACPCPCACPSPCACPDSGQPQGVAPTCDGQLRGGEQPQGAGQARRPAPTLGIGQPQGVARALSLPEVVHRFKTLTTKRYADGVKRLGWPPFPKNLWQRNYYEHIIRDEDDLTRIREYIVNNPLQWALDRENPANAGQQPGEP